MIYLEYETGNAFLGIHLKMNKAYLQQMQHIKTLLSDTAKSCNHDWYKFTVSERRTLLALISQLNHLEQTYYLITGKDYD